MPFTPGDRPAAAGAARRAATKRAPCWWAGSRRCATQPALLGARHLPAQEEWRALGAKGFLQRTDQQFHWINEGYGSFDDFLAALASRKRKAIKRERRDALANGITVEQLTGKDITEAHWDAFFAFYMDTGSRKWGRPYLNRTFFSLIGERMADQILLIMAKRGGRYIAGAINFIGSDTLYGRNWGCVEDHPFLHFEVCYYQAIDFAIARGLKRVEAGAQGEHKLARGYRPVTTYSAHDIADPALRRAVADYLERERAYVEAAQEELMEHVPFRKGRAAGTGVTRLTRQRRPCDIGRPHRSAAMTRLRSQQHVRQDPAGRDALREGLRGRAYAGAHGHHAARRRPRAGRPQGPCARHPGHRARGSRRGSRAVQKVAER